MKKRFAFAAAMLAAVLTFAGCASMTPEWGWTALTDGASGMDNWTLSGATANWRAEDGAIQADKLTAGKGASVLITKKNYRDIEVYADQRPFGRARPAPARSAPVCTTNPLTSSSPPPRDTAHAAQPQAGQQEAAHRRKAHAPREPDDELRVDPRLSEGALKCPIFQTSTFVFESAEEGKAFFEVAYGLRELGAGEHTGLIYSRLNNPDLEVLEDRLTLWDGAEACTVFESGMRASATTLLAYARRGDAILYSRPLYGGSEHLLQHFFSQYGVTAIGFSAGLPAAEIADHLQSCLLVGSLVYIQVANPDSTRDHRDAAVLSAELMQARSAARDHHVHVLI